MDYSYKDRKILGSWGEQVAAEYLQSLGYEVICRNYRCYYGELDLVCRLQTIWCFVEVKTRKSMQYGDGLQAITPTKQKHLRSAARYFLCQRNLVDVAARFDVVAIKYISKTEYEISLVQNAF
jgi:putative endonuclease